MKYIYTKATCTMNGKTYKGVSVNLVGYGVDIIKEDILSSEKEALRNLMSKIPEYKYAKTKI
mgnify:CR=1 FL=1